MLGSIPGLGMLFEIERHLRKAKFDGVLASDRLKNQADIAEATERKFNRVFELEIEGEGPLSIPSATCLMALIEPLNSLIESLQYRITAFWLKPTCWA